MKFMLSFLLCCLLLTGCSTRNVPETQPETTEPPEAPSAEIQTEPASAASDSGSLWQLTEGHTFCLSSGAGGWRCQLTVDAGGQFLGDYTDSNLGETGDGYPNGTIYQSRFKGRFSEPQWNGPGNYLFRVETLQDLDPIQARIENGTMVRSVHADQLEGDAFFLYVPGKATSELPEEVLHWLPFPDREKSRLTSYVIHNNDAQLAFVSDPAAPWLAGQNLLQMAEDEAEFLEGGAHIPDASQTDINDSAQAVYECWDIALNDLWSMLTDSLDQVHMQPLLEAQRLWIQEKEAAAQEAASEAEGGSLYPALYYGTAAQWTRERAVYLADALPRE